MFNFDFRYIQIGNAVSFAVSTGLGYTLAKAIQGVCTSKQLELTVKFPECLAQLSLLNEDSKESKWLNNWRITCANDC